MDAFSRQQCLEGTRVEILQSITDWLSTPSGGQNILWLHGPAGSGKSSISTTIAERFRELHRLGAFIFFDRNDPVQSDPRAVIRTMAHQLACADPNIQSAICEKINGVFNVSTPPIHTQFIKLLLEPLTTVAEQHRKGPIVIILDALDECGDFKSRRSLVALLAKEFATLPSIFRFLITSRAEADIDPPFSMDHIHRLELDTMTQSTAVDVRLYIRHEMSIITDHYKLPRNWPGDKKLQTLVDHSAGLFIWASTATAFIREGHDPVEQLDILMKSESHERGGFSLDHLYATALLAAGKWDSVTFAEDFRKILGTVILGRVPLTNIAMDRILGLQCRRASEFILSRLRCLLQWGPGQPVRALHASLADYLTHNDRCGSDPWFIDVSKQHHTLALGCLRVLKSGLRFNICELETSHVRNHDVSKLSERVKTAFPDDLSYSSRFWADHLELVARDSEVLSGVRNLMYNGFLYWLEALSLLKEVPVASPALLWTAEWCRVSARVADYISNMWWLRCDLSGER